MSRQVCAGVIPVLARRRANGNPVLRIIKTWIPAGVYPDENRGRNDKEKTEKRNQEATHLRRGRFL
jgi:hypothetical protein